MSAKRKKLKSDLGWSTTDRIVVRGHDLVDLIGKVPLGDFAFLELKPLAGLLDQMLRTNVHGSPPTASLI